MVSRRANVQPRCQQAALIEKCREFGHVVRVEFELLWSEIPLRIGILGMTST